ncbi:hypothetical protein E1B28_000186 [Marasmius oreades]|uniref:Uncharacterized protein n=1 Tax=Marasmius oreades TaxID=181124 RepID=A0A9P8AE31_9AGAR|nr:uncharacterized protein E1B28_000186 [Marasmius oreades]KAG7098219.1 hypothetical protein E1B28_000186 [Marasmius oreades]
MSSGRALRDTNELAIVILLGIIREYKYIQGNGSNTLQNFKLQGLSSKFQPLKHSHLIAALPLGPSRVNLLPFHTLTDDEKNSSVSYSFDHCRRRNALRCF